MKQQPRELQFSTFPGLTVGRQTALCHHLNNRYTTPHPSITSPANNFEGQLEGGMDMGVGYALREQYVVGETKDWITFKFPTMKTSFDMEVVIRETVRIRGTLGATGVGEMSMVATAPAVINAIKNGCGALITSLPATPDKVLAALKKGDN